MADTPEWNGDTPETTYDPSPVEVDRGRQQGLGMGHATWPASATPHVPEAAEGNSKAPDATP